MKPSRKASFDHHMAIISGLNIPYIEFSDIHIRMNEWDFWPSTGKYYNRLMNAKGSGLEELIDILRAEGWILL